MKAAQPQLPLKTLSLAVAIGIALSVQAEPSLDQLLKGAAGGAAGGVVGNQMGKGEGKTATTAAGAALGSVIASGCKVTTGTAIGGVIGGLIGSQFGSGNGKNAMAGVGAAAGAMLGSDCSPVAMASPPVALLLPPFKFNGLTMTPVSGFPLEAFRGVPPISTTQDIAAAREIVPALSRSAQESYKAGDTETALLKMYWAKRISSVALSVAGASMTAIASVQESRGTSAAIPAKTLVILPTFDQEKPLDKLMARWEAIEQRVAGLSMAEPGIQVADNNLSSLLGTVNQMLGGKPVGAPGNAPGAAGATPKAASGAPDIRPELLGLPENQVLKLPNGAFIMKSQGSLTVYNAGDQAIVLPLEKLDFMPRTPEPSAARKAAAELMLAMTKNAADWSFLDYKKRIWAFENRIVPPNQVVDLLNGSKAVAYLDSFGAVTPFKEEGERAYRENKNFRLAIDLVSKSEVSKPIAEFREQCKKVAPSHYGKLRGTYANIATSICFRGNYGSEEQVATRTFWIGDDGNAVQTLASLMDDKAVVATMKQAMDYGAVASDVIGLIPGPLGNVESGLQCIGSPTLAQMQAVGMVLNTANYKKGKALDNVGFAKAKLAGWEPDEQEWGVERVANCLGAIPLAGNAVKGVKVVGKDVLASVQNLDKVEMAFKAFDTPKTFADYVKAVQTTEALFPGNTRAAGYIKGMYTTVMSGSNLIQLKKDIGNAIEVSMQ